MGIVYETIIVFERICQGFQVLFNKLKLTSSGVVVGQNVIIKGKLNLILKGTPHNISIGDNFLCNGDIDLYVRENGAINIDNNVQMDGDIHITAANDAVVTIGEGTRVCTHFTINAGANVSIGKHCLIPDFCHINASDHNVKLGFPFLEQGYTHCPIKVGNDVHFGAFTCVKKGAEICDGVILGYQSVVIGKIDENSIAFGAPAKAIKRRT